MTRAMIGSSWNNSRTWRRPATCCWGSSGSGNSPNILKAVDWANQSGLTTVGFTGFSGGKLKTLAHHNLHVAVADMGIVGDYLHQVVFHWLIDDLYRRFSAKMATLNGARAH